MDKNLYCALYAKAAALRNRLMRDPRLADFFPSDSQSFPPVLGFGLPPDARNVPLVTVALNAAAAEFPRHLPQDDDPEIQWHAQARYFANPYKKWWPRASEMLRAATRGRITYAGAREAAAHVDFTPVVTPNGMDGVYDAIKHRIRDDMRTWLDKSLTETFVNLLSGLVDGNEVKAVLVFGFAPAFPGKDASGAITLRDSFRSNENVNFVDRGGLAGAAGLPTVAWGSMVGRSVPDNLRESPSCRRDRVQKAR